MIHLYTDLKTEGDGTQRRSFIGDEAALLGVDNEHFILPGQQVVARGIETKRVYSELLCPVLGGGEADGEVLQTQMVGRAEEASRRDVLIRRLIGW